MRAFARLLPAILAVASVPAWAGFSVTVSSSSSGVIGISSGCFADVPSAIQSLSSNFAGASVSVTSVDLAGNWSATAGMVLLAGSSSNCILGPAPGGGLTGQTGTSTTPGGSSGTTGGFTSSSSSATSADIQALDTDIKASIAPVAAFASQALPFFQAGGLSSFLIALSFFIAFALGFSTGVKSQRGQF